MEQWLNFWRGLGRGGRAGFAAGVVAIVVAMSALALWGLRTDYGVLFSDLSQADLATMAGELDKMKLPYKIGPDGNSLVVPEGLVHKTRVSLMGRDMPLKGAVGFELFNNMEFGVSEFVQKVNYQRALQGELTRTLLAIDEVQAVRVHLALTEQSLFRKDAGKSKASVTVTMKPGRSLQPTQVQGIQRLVAASAAEVQAQDVTVLDQHGVALSRGTQGETASLDAAGPDLESKRSVESYLAQKATRVLDRMFGAGESMVSVDAVFSHEHTRVTTEEVLAARGGDATQPATGVVLRERQTTRDSSSDAARSAPVVTSSETDYQTGKRTEQVVSPAGSLKQLNVAVVVKRPLSEAELQRVRELVGASVGLNRGRGDVVSVHSMEQLQTEALPQGATPLPGVVSPVAPVAKPTATDASRVVVVALAGLLLAVFAAVFAATLLRRSRHAAPVPVLDDAQRALMLQTVQQWLTSEPAREARSGPR